MLAAGALVASLFAVGAAPAAAAAIDAKSEPSAEADFSACVGDAVKDHGFTDLGSLDAAVPHINCLAYYGITKGRTADTFDPDSNVTRSEMALFLYRAAGPMGVDLMGGDSDMMADYGDVAELGEDRQNAIRALARNDILMGRDMGNFYPHADITRAEMAVALVALLDHVPGAKVEKNDAGLYLVDGKATPPDSFFADARASVPRSVDNAISAAYELGITAGVGDGTMFNPGGSVPRRDMAAFIMRAAAHSKLRPEGLTAQNVNGTITVSVRDADFKPVPNQAVDAFKAAAGESRLFTSAGACSSRVARVDGSKNCEVDGADPVTRTDGDALLANQGRGDVGEGLTVWVWQGDVGDKFSEGDWAYELAVAPPESVAMPESAAVSDSLPDGITRARFGATVTVTVQLKDGGGDDTGRGKVGGAESFEYTVVINKYGAVDGTDPDGSGDAFDTETVKAKVGDDGSATFTLDATDANDTMGNRVRVAYTITGGDFSSNGTTGPNLQPVDSDPATWFVLFTDEAPIVKDLEVEVAPYQEAPGANETVGSAATVTATDQFGRPFEDAGIVLTSTTNNSAGTRPSQRFTGPDGRVRIGYDYSGGASVETLTATYTPPGDSPQPVTGTGMAFWVTPWETTTTNQGNQTTVLDVLNVDLEADQVVVGTSNPLSVNYDSGDFFTVNGEPSSIAKFEEELAKILKAKNDEGGDFNGALTLAWQSYDHEDSSDIASFTLTATPSS